jgi:hypothetical protein
MEKPAVATAVIQYCSRCIQMLDYESFGLPHPRLMSKSGDWISSVNGLLLIRNAMHSSHFPRIVDKFSSHAIMTLA